MSSDSKIEQLERDELVEGRLGLPRGFLKHRRASPGGPRYYRLGRRTVVYRLSDVASWIAQCCESAPSRKVGA
jgi:hypothetical protein